MTDLLKIAIEAVQALPDAEQDAIARQILATVYSDEAVALDEIPPEDLPSVLEGLAQLERGKIATDEEVEAAFASFG